MKKSRRRQGKREESKMKNFIVAAFFLFSYKR